MLLTDWKDYLALDWKAVGAAMRGRAVIDLRNVFDSEEVTAQGLNYDGIGARPVTAGASKVSPEIAAAE